MSNQEQATRKSYGPFLVKGGSALPVEFFSIPWSKVVEAVIMVAVSDDIDSNPSTAGILTNAILVGSEITIYGVIQGYATPLKTVFVTGKTGPVDLELPSEEGYEYIQLRARIMNGGRPLAPPFGSNAAAAAGLASINHTVYIMPRTGFKGVING